MRIFAIIALALLSIPTLQAQKIGQKVKNQLFLKALLLECPECVDKRGRLLPQAAQVESLTLDLDGYDYSDWDWITGSDRDSRPISFQAFSNLKNLSLRHRELIYIKAWPPNLEKLDIEYAEFAEPMPMLPAGLKKLQLGEAYYNPASGEFYKRRFFDYPLPQGLEELSAGSMHLDSIPNNLPASLKQLSLSRNKISSISNLPANLSRLILDGNQISKLDAVQWPDSLRFLDLSGNPISTLPKDWGNCKLQLLWLNSLPADYNKDNSKLELHLPASLLEFSLTNSRLAELSGEFPQGLRWLNLSFNILRKIPALPDNLGYINVENNQLDSLWVGHTALTSIHVGTNKLVYIDQLPNTLLHLDCGENQLSSLPNLNKTQLKELICYRNQLSKLPQPLPQTLKKLYCGVNKLKFLPPLPAGIEYVSFFDNPILAYPDVPAGLKAIDKTTYQKE